MVEDVLRMVEVRIEESARFEPAEQKFDEDGQPIPSEDGRNTFWR